MNCFELQGFKVGDGLRHVKLHNVGGARAATCLSCDGKPRGRWVLMWPLERSTKQEATPVEQMPIPHTLPS